jgi:hypothetical protein
MSSTEQFVQSVLDRVPELDAIHQVHIDDNGSLLPHVFMGDVTRFALQIAQHAEQMDVLRRLLELVETGLQSSDREVVDLVAVSFIENLCGEDAAVAILIPLMGEATRRELSSLCGY